MGLNINQGAGTNFEVQGLSELLRKMKNLEPQIKSKAIWSALLSGAQVVKKEVERTAPKLTGRLDNSILVKNIKGKGYIIGIRHGHKEQKAVVRVKGVKQTVNRDAFYWTFQEFGTKFFSGKHFLENAMKNKYQEALKRIQEKLTEKIKQLVPTL